jgi:hypothetical protein
MIIGFSLKLIILLICGSCTLLLLVYFGIAYIRGKSESFGYSPLSAEADEDGLQRMRDLMEHHVPCSITFRNTGYVIDTDKQIPSITDTSLADDEEINLDDQILDPQPGRKLKQVVLKDIQGSLNPGQIMAIMGGSGRSRG